ncbi:MAG: hypothetical protein LBQ54_09250, partial [Planctomycetaceae bacterium]|nr:hypothetical protein [Planctomycetaceae bacterium]
GGRIRPGKKVRGEKSDPPSSPSREAPAGGWSCRSEAITRSRWSLRSVPLHRTSQAVGKIFPPDVEWNAMTMRLSPARASGYDATASCRATLLSQHS